MADTTILEVSGLQLSNNTFSASPPGSLLVADNVVISQKGVAEPRNGQTRFSTLPTSTSFPFALTEFQGSTIVSYATSKDSTSYGLGIASGTTTAFSGGPYNPVDCDGVNTSYGRMKFGFSNSYLNFCTTTGPKVLESTVSQPRSAGLLPMPDIVATMLSANSGDPGWLPYGCSVAYRSALRKETTDGTSLLSPPSGRVVVTNRILAPVGGMVRTGGNLVTVTVPGTTNPGLQVGDTFTLTPGEADFAAGSYTVASVTANVFTYTSVGANTSNTVAQDFNTGPRAVSLLIKLSEDTTTTTPVRYYRSVAVSGPPITANTTTPSDELFLANEVFPTALQVANGFILTSDITPESVLNDPLYTNPQTGQGAAQANYPPPIYRDLAFWAGRMWYANTTGQHQFRLQMLGVGSPDGIQNNDTLTVTVPGAVGSPYVFTFKNTPVTTDQPQIVSNGTPSFNIQQTSANLVTSLNAVLAFNNAGVSAYYSSGQTDAPGKILLERTDYSDTAFSITVSRPESWIPALSSSTATSSTNSRQPNQLAYSKLNEAEAVPLVNYLPVGSKNYAISRILGLRNALLVFKEGDGIYSVTGSAPFLVTQVSTANITAPDCAAVFADSAWVYTDQGILRVSDTGGTQVVSRPIETELNTFAARFPEETFDYSFAVPYEVERRIMFFVPVDFATDGPDRPVLEAYCYCLATNAWTKFIAGDAFSGHVSPSARKLVLGIYDRAWNTTRLTLERKGGGYLDKADSDFSNTIDVTNFNGNPRLIRVTDPTDIEVGDGVTQFGSRTKITALRPDLGAGFLELAESMTWSVGACTIYKAYPVRVQFQPVGQPSQRKNLTRLSLLFKPEQFANYFGQTILATDQIQADLEIDTPGLGFGSTSFGTGPFGNPTPMVVDVNPIDQKWVGAGQFFPGYALNEVWCKFRLQGVSLTLDAATGPVGRGR